MENLEQIKKYLRSGDQKLCAEITEYTEDYVKKVIAEERKNEKIITVLTEIIENRKKLIARLKSFNYKPQS